jgi:ABC-type transporter Mla MlaB component
MQNLALCFPRVYASACCGIFACLYVAAIHCRKSNCGELHVAILTIADRAHEYRITISGKLAGDSVYELERIWTSACADCLHRELAIDISGLSGYDTAGCKLLRQIYRHGAKFAASTPSSLVLLGEISTPRRRGPALVQEKPAETKQPEAARKEVRQSRAAASE